MKDELSHGQRAPNKVRDKVRNPSDAHGPAHPHHPDVAPEVQRAYRACRGARIEALAGGLINQTFAVSHPSGEFILQRVNPMFDPSVHGNISAVTEHLFKQGIVTPLLCNTDAGHSHIIDDAGGCWRLQTRVSGDCIGHIASPDEAHATGALLGRWHHALDDLDHAFVGLRPDIHNTAAHHKKLVTALEQHREHALAPEVRSLATSLESRYRQLPAIDLGVTCIVHGDPKLANILFETSASGERRPTCLIDLDTVGRQPLAHELGDAWRSWCSPTSEGDASAHFRIDLFEATVAGYAQGRGRALDGREARSLLHAIDWISLELAMRFAADALLESYFGWDPDRYPSRGAHNLARARGQWALHQSAAATLTKRARALGLAWEGPS